MNWTSVVTFLGLMEVFAGFGVSKLLLLEDVFSFVAFDGVLERVREAGKMELCLERRLLLLDPGVSDLPERPESLEDTSLGDSLGGVVLDFSVLLGVLLGVRAKGGLPLLLELMFEKTIGKDNKIWAQKAR